jgi:protein-tyrosine phosphatase
MKILMVCLGNICRSPMAEGIIRHKLNERGLKATIDSAGTGGWHAGESPDPRAIQTMQQHGIDISKLVARQFKKNDLGHFDLILAMDETNHVDIIDLVTDMKDKEKVKLILDYSAIHKGCSVPDPWYGGDEGFEAVYQMLDEACEQVIKHHFHEER